MLNSPFTVAGMAASTSTHHHSPNLNSWGGQSASAQPSFSDSLSQSRSHYQPGYLMSSQNNNAPQGNQRSADEVPTVQTKAKMNTILSRGSTSDFGMDSMFESTRQRQKLADQDAPPTNSINDIPNEIVHTPSPRNQPPLKNATQEPQRSAFGSSFARRSQRPATTPTTPQQPSQTLPINIIVFGYPPEKYSLVVEYFQSLGATTDPNPHLEIQNCFRIGYADAGDALRAVRKNGEVLGGSWMIGAVWADPKQGEALMAQSPLLAVPESASDNAMAVDAQTSPRNGANTSGMGTPNTLTPLKPAPASAAFRRHHPETVATPQPQRGWGSTQPAPLSQLPTQPQQSAPPQSKGVLGSVSDLIFGW